MNSCWNAFEEWVILISNRYTRVNYVNFWMFMSDGQLSWKTPWEGYKIFKHYYPHGTITDFTKWLVHNYN